MKLVRIVVVVAAAVGLVAAAAVYAPTALGQALVAPRAERAPVAQAWAFGGSRIGVSIRDVDQADVEREKLPGLWGAAIEEVRSDSPAEKAGLQAGDVMIEFDGERVRSARQLSRLVQETPEGRTVKAAVVRAGRRVDVEVTPDRRGSIGYLGEAERALERVGRDLRFELEGLRELDRLRDFEFTMPPLEFSPRLRTSRLGIQAQSLTEQLGAHLGAKEGVLVTTVDPDSVAAKAGLKAGDVITAIDDASVASLSDLRRRLDRIEEGEAFTIAIVRDRKPMTLEGKVEDRRIRQRRRIVGEI